MISSSLALSRNVLYKCGVITSSSGISKMKHSTLLSSKIITRRRKPAVNLLSNSVRQRRRTTNKSQQSKQEQQTSKSSNSFIPPKSFCIGTMAGMLGSLAGMGGGFVMIPMMTSRRIGISLTQHEAHGTSLFAVAATGLAGSISFGSNVVQYPEAIAVALTAMITSRLGAQTTISLSERTLKQLLGLLMLCMAPAVPAKAYYLQQLDEKEKQLQKQSQQDVIDESTTSNNKEVSNLDENNNNNNSIIDNMLSKNLIAPAMIGLGSGYLAGLFGVGGGTIVVPALTIFTNMNHHEALGTSLAAMIPPAIIGTYTHYTIGNIKSLRVAPFLAIGALFGSYIGAQNALHTNETTLRWGFSALLTTLGIRTIMKA